MPLNSIQYFTKGVLDGLAIPGSTTALKAQITPPTIQGLSGPVAFVWGGSMRTTRQTGPRGKPGAAGFKKQLWDVDVTLVYLTNPRNDRVDQAFPLVVDAVLAQVWSTTMPVPITDPTTGLESQVLQFGEDYRLDYTFVRTPASDRMLFYEARLTLSVYEAVNA